MPEVISILSDQLIPNVLFIKQMTGNGDKHVFLSTEEMEGKHKSQTLANTLGLGKDDYDLVVIDQNNPQKISVVLEKKFPISSGGAFIVNITGGTKMMSQWTYLHFRQFEHSQIFYWPIDEHYLEQLHPVFRQFQFKNDVRLDLKTYFAAYGYSFIKADKLAFSHGRANKLMNKVIHAGDSALVSEIAAASAEDYRKEDRQYLTGGWFEEWLYHRLKNELHLSDDEIGLNLKLKNEASVRTFESDNEIDVAFVFKNVLYIIECKVYTAKQLSGKRITDAIYKISSLRQSLGLKATAMVFILSSFGNSKGRKNAIQDMMRMANVKRVFSLEEISNQQILFKQLKALIFYD